MPLPNIFRRLKAETSSLDELSTELGRLDKAKLDAENRLHDLGARRPALLVEYDVDALVAHDAEMAKVRATIEQVSARIALITPEWQDADRRETEIRANTERRDRHAAAVKARFEGTKLLASYQAAAADLAAKLRRLVEIEQQITVANEDLPDNAAPIAAVEPFNGRRRTPDTWPEHDVWIDGNGDHRGIAAPGQTPPHHGYTRKTIYSFTAIPGVPGFEHRPLAARVALPAIDPAAPAYWAPGVGTPRRSVEAEAFLLQHGVRP